jgi:predicted DNA-binding transcriptional regulator YafY
MDRTERFYQIDQMLQPGRPVPIERFLEALGVSRATFKRDLEYMRDRLNAPIEWDRFEGGYRYAEPAGGPAFALPGLWFNASEAHALLMMQQLLADLQPGLLGAQVAPLQARLRALLGSADHSVEEVERRVRIVTAARRRLAVRHFEAVASATLRRRRLRIAHYSRATDETTERAVSPQQLVFYRENWYLVAWCHLRRDIRSFAIDAIVRVEPLEAAAHEVDRDALAEVIESGYGIFSGRDVTWATLRFEAERSRWVAAEVWHPQQRGRFDDARRWVLEVPYSDPRELSMDVLKHGASVEVLAPASLRAAIASELAAAVGRYAGMPSACAAPAEGDAAAAGGGGPGTAAATEPRAA